MGDGPSFFQKSELKTHTNTSFTTMALSFLNRRMLIAHIERVDIIQTREVI